MYISESFICHQINEYLNNIFQMKFYFQTLAPVSKLTDENTAGCQNIYVFISFLVQYKQSNSYKNKENCPKSFSI